MKTVEKERRESPENMHVPDIKIKEFKEEKSLNGAKCSWKPEENNNLGFIKNLITDKKYLKEQF